MAYDDPRGREKSISDSFGKLNHPVRFAAGTAEEVLDWVNDGLVDIAVLSPGAFAATTATVRLHEREMQRAAGVLPAWDCQYLITPHLLGSRSPFAQPPRTEAGGFTYRPLCLVNRKSFKALQDHYAGSAIDCLRSAAANGRVQFVFGDPLSLSGTIVPRVQLTELGIQWEQHSEMSFGHGDTLHLLLNTPDLKVGDTTLVRVGFVFDGSIPRPPRDVDSPDSWLTDQLNRMRDELVAIPLPPPGDPLHQQPSTHESNPRTDGIAELPAEVWVVRPDFDHKQLQALQQGLLGLNTPGLQLFKDQGDPLVQRNEMDLWADRVRSWARLARIHLGQSNRSRPIAFDQIIHSMRHYRRRYGDIPRLALVLSGGGAKCAYQVGVIDEIEQQLESLAMYSLKEDVGDQLLRPDVSLVVGTSGGALNALPTAIGITKTAEGRAKLGELWTASHLADVINPFPLIRWLLALPAVGLLIVLAKGLQLVLRCASQWTTIRVTCEAPEQRGLCSFLWRCFPYWSVAAAFSGFAIFRTAAPDTVRSFAPESRLATVFWWTPLNVALGELVAVSIVLAFLISALDYDRRRRRPEGALSNDDRTPCRLRHEIVAWRIIAGLGASLVLLIVGAMAWAPSLSDGKHMQSHVLDGMERLFKGVIRENRSSTGTIDHRISVLSDALCDERLHRHRDFVMTVSLLGSDGPADRYVYLPARTDGAAPSYERRAINLDRGSQLHFVEDPKQVVPLLVASGTIFPIFPARPFIDPTGRSSDMYIVDGGFAHNIPIEAAVDWGATHIIVVEASPTADLREKDTFLENLATAFDHLFVQAQLTDTRSRDRVEIYTIRPGTELLKTLDFIPSKMAAAIRQGQYDVASGRFFQFSRAPRLGGLNTAHDLGDTTP